MIANLQLIINANYGHRFVSADAVRRYFLGVFAAALGKTADKLKQKDVRIRNVGRAARRQSADGLYRRRG